MVVDAEEYYRKYGPMVLRRCWRLLHDAEMAVDAMHDVFANLLRSRDRVVPERPASLLLRVSTSVCLNVLRAERRRPEDSGDEQLRAIACAEQQEERSMTRFTLGSLVGGEAESTRVMAVMHLVDGLSLKEVGDEVGLSVAGVHRPEHGTVAWFEAEGLERRVSPSPTDDGLRPRLLPGLADSKGEEALVPSDEPAEVKRRVQEALGEVRAAERARTPDRELGDMQAALAGGFAAPWSATEGGAGPAVSSTLAQVADAYMRTAEQYGRTGGLSGENAYAREIVALVRVTSAEGGTIEIALAASSGHRAYDWLALARAREAAATEAVAAAMRKHRRAIWAFVTRFEIVPPVPGVGCGLDALLHLDLGRCVYPLKKLPPVSRVELRGVE